MKNHIIEESPVATFLLSNPKMSWIWFIVRVYVGWQWLHAGWGKIHSATWVGADAGASLTGFVNGALAKTAGAHPDVSGWYAYFLEHVILPNTATWAHVVAWGEFLVGVALIIGLLTGIAAFFGLFMNINFLLAGTLSINPVLLILSIGLILAWRIAGYLGADYYFLRWIGTPWHPGSLTKAKPRII